ncbi:hypothetical protein H5410_056466 [Solanum commersonii]|uniref:Uncharacterized protein n=1 Tax=Solanum commersonii TaxID=4109 RepID=A0A9J5WMC0_SOLCO|nr:hypothetical protein H5410_056466 [Solanum commersonii]
MELLVIQIFDVIFPKLFVDVCQDLSYGVVLSRRTNRPIFKVRRAPKLVNHPFHQFSCAIVHGSFEPVGSDGQNDLFSRSNEPRAINLPLYQFLCAISIKTLAMELVGLDRQMAHCQGQIIPGVGKSPILPIYVYSPCIF